MCGRFAIANPKFRKIEAALGTSFHEVKPRFNVAPTQQIPVVRQAGAAGTAYELAEMRWGLIPHWSHEPSTKFTTFNARAETAETKPAFRDPFRLRRCLIPVSGFYEWETSGKEKKPYYFTGAEGDGLVLAGLWDEWSSQDEHLLSCTILVGQPNRLLAAIHDRMPIILHEGAYARWLDPRTLLREIRPMLVPYPAELMTGWPVSAAVGNSRNDSPALIDPIESTPAQ